MEFIVENWYIIFALLMLVGVLVIIAVRFLRQPTETQLEKVREWLLYAVTLAEKELGGGTGKLKLRYVYGLFVDKFTWLAKLLPFESFSDMVDDALEQMNKLLSSNTAVQLYVNGPTEVEDETAEG